MKTGGRPAAPGGHEIRAIVFDWDQTLWDSWTLHLRGIQHAAGSLDLPEPSPQRVLDTFGGTLEEHLVRLYGSMERPLAGYMEFYRAHRGALGRLFPGVAEVLEALRRAEYRLAVLSDKVVAAGREELALVDLADCFHAAVFRDGASLAKPHPQGLLRTLDELHVAPEEAMYVGDAPWDVECARRAGVRSVGALWGCVDVPALLAARPDLVWREPSQALKLLEREGA
jgi:HAD superfamily hydrolase (TIGR01509 family)